MGRLNVLQLLFDLTQIDDTKRQSHGKTPMDVAKDDKTTEFFKRQTEEYIAAVTTAMKNAIDWGDHHAIETFFDQNTRAKSYLNQGWIDINASLMANGMSILHLAAQKDNLELVVWALKCGADPNVKNQNDKKPHNLTKNEQIRYMLKHSKAQTPIISPSLSQAAHSDGLIEKEAPVLRGWLQKWTNYMDNYKQRYFVLEGGVFSYYHDESDYPAACRGSISTLSVNAFFPDSKSDASRFDVIGAGGVKYSLKARSTADAKKWVWNLMESRGWMSETKGKRSRSNSEKRSSFTFVSTDELTHLVPIDHDSPIKEDPKEEEEDLFTYLETHSSNDFNTPELQRFLVLLQTEMKVQKETVQTALGLVNQITIAQETLDPATKTQPSSALQNLLQLPKLLTSSSLHIETLIFGIVRHCNKREHIWENKLKKTKDAYERLEKIIAKISILEPGLTQEFIEPAMKPIENLTINTEFDSSEDEFFDANDMADITPKSIEDIQVRIQLPTHREELPEQIDHFLKSSDFEDSKNGYGKIMGGRERLPLNPDIPMPKLAIWSFLKSAIGKDLTKISLPVLFNEPISMLQRLCEDIEFIELLSLAARVGNKTLAKISDKPARTICSSLGLDYQKLENLKGTDADLFKLMLVGAFAMSNYSSTAGRVSKPFNPMLGETYELVHTEKNYRYIAEQVCHHPPISAAYCESPDYAFWTEVNVKSKFWGKSLEVQPLGNSHVRLPHEDGTEHYSWKKVTTLVNNLIMGTLTIEHYGDLVVKNHRTGDELTLTFKAPAGNWFGSKDKKQEGRQLSGTVKDSEGTLRYELQGKWDESLIAVPLGRNPYSEKPFTIWKINPTPEFHLINFHFSHFTMLLNQTTPELDVLLPLTDSRNRPDQRAMENGHWDDADVKKSILEKNQRNLRNAIIKEYEENLIPNGPAGKGMEYGEKWWNPRWFAREVEKDTGEEHWRFTEEYWKYRKTEWPAYVLDIFGINE